MERTFTAVFEDGVFKPSITPDLPPGAVVHLTLVDSDAPSSGDDQDWEEFGKCLDELSFDSGGTVPTRDELHDRT